MDFNLREILGMITLTISILGITGSLSLFHRRRKMETILQQAKLKAPADKKSIRDYLRYPDKQERLDAFYNASKFFRIMLLFVFGLGLFIIISVLFFYVRFDSSDIRQPLIPVGSTQGATNTLILKDISGVTRQWSLDHGKAILIHIDQETALYTVPIPTSDQTYLVMDNSGKISNANLPELVLGFLVFLFIIAIVICVFWMGRMDDFIDRFEELEAAAE